MRNITAFTVLVIILCCGPPVMAQEQLNYTVSLKPLFGFVSGQAEEIVYPSSRFQAPLHSLLLWDMKPVVYYGFLLDFSQVEPMNTWGGFATFSLKYGIPGPSGIHDNSDWLSVENAGLTHFSRHDNHTRELFFLDFTSGFSFPLNCALFLRTYLQVSFIRMSFFGMDGYGIYARSSGNDTYHPISDDPRKETFEGKVISYTQEWFYAAPGVSLGYFYDDNFLIELSFMASPLILCSALDEHKTTNFQYRDQMWGGILFEPGIRLSLALGKWFDISWELSWRYINGTKGMTYQRRPIGTGTYVQGGAAGAGLSIINTGLGFRVRL